MRFKKGIMIYILCLVMTAGMPVSVNAATDISTLKTEAKDELTAYMNIIGIPDSNEAEANNILTEAKNNIETYGTSESTIDTIVSTTKTKLDALVATSDTDTSGAGSIVVGNNWATPQATYGQSVNIVLPLVNMGDSEVTDVTVTPVVSADVGSWPFEIQQSNYSQSIANMPGENSGLSAYDRRRELTWSLVTRDNVTNAYIPLSFSITYKNADGSVGSASVTTYVETIGAPGSGDGTESGNTSTPRIIITGFTTNPDTVKAGETFVLTLHMKNTSTRTAVNNVQFDIQAAVEGKDEETVSNAFLPTAGSSTIFVESIGKNQTKDINMEMSAKSDLLQKPYQITVTMNYEDENINSFTSTASVSIPVKQEARLDISEPEVMPASIDVGAESNIMFSIYNTGKTKLYNVSVKLEGDSISGGDAFIGNIESGATGNVDTMVTGAAATMDDGIIKALITYEDESGNPTTIEKEMNLFVTEPVFDEGMDGDYMGEEMPAVEEPKSKLPLIIAVILILIAAVVIVFIIIRRKKKKAKKLKEEMDFIDEDILEEDNDESTEAVKQGEGNEDEIS